MKPYIRKKGYKKSLQKFNKKLLLTYISRSSFLGLFYPTYVFLMKIHPYSDASPDVFFEFMMEQPIPVIQKVLDYVKSGKTVYGYEKLALVVYQEVSLQLEARLQYKLLDETLPKKQTLKNSGGKI